MGLLEEKDSVHIPKGNYDGVEGDEYYAYPQNHITVVDLRQDEITFQGHLCTSRGMDGENDMYEEI